MGDRPAGHTRPSGHVRHRRRALARFSPNRHRPTIGRAKVLRLDLPKTPTLLTPSDIVHTLILTDQLTWSFDNSRHFMGSIDYVKRNEIFCDLSSRLAARAQESER